MTFAILGTGGHAKSVYDIVKKKKFIFLINKINFLNLTKENSLLKVISYCYKIIKKKFLK